MTCSLRIKQRKKALDLRQILVLEFDRLLVRKPFFLVFGCFKGDHFAECFGVTAEVQPMDFDERVLHLEISHESIVFEHAMGERV